MSLSLPEIRKMGEIIHSSGERLNRLMHKYLLYQELEDAVKGSEHDVEAYRKARVAVLNRGVRKVEDVILHMAKSIAGRAQREQDLAIELESASLPVS